MPFGGPLQPELLYVAVFGAGSGECIMVRSPEVAAWLVVDSFRLTSPRGAAAAGGLNRLKCEWAALVLTHPHTDHAGGFVELLNAPGRGPIGCFMPPPDPSADEDHINWPYQQPGLEAQAALQAIRTRWDVDNQARWDFANDLTPRTVGILDVLPLWPRADIEVTTARLNAWSTPLLMSWGKLNVLLGADLPAPQWRALSGAANAPDLGAHSALKVSHHASVGAQASEVLAGGDANRFAGTTPFFRHQLPRFDEREGADVVLQQRAALALTALPDADYPKTLTREEALRLQSESTTGRRTLGTPTRRVVRRDALICWHLIGLDADGVERDRRRGSAATVITP